MTSISQKKIWFNLLPGDTVLVDREFDIKDSVGLYCATVTLPAFMRGKRQLIGIHLGIGVHVKRVLGNLRQIYSFLSTTQSVDYLLCKAGDNVTIIYKIISLLFTDN